MKTSTRFAFPFLLIAAASGCNNTDTDGAGGAGGGQATGGGAATSTATGQGGEASGTGSGGASTATTTTGSGGSGGATACFEPTPASGDDGFVASDAANAATFTFTLPDDPEGGLVTVTVSGLDILANVRVEADAENSFLSVNGSSDVITAYTQSFVGAPGMTYAIDIEEIGVTGTDATSPVDFTWSLETTRDCFEPNDTPAEARALALGEAAEAYLFAGYTTNEWPSYEDHDDYFEVELEQAGTLTVDVQPGPDPLTLEVAASDAPDTLLADTYSLDETPFAVELEAPAGRYLLRVTPFVSPIYNTFDGDPTQWDQPYTVQASVQ